MEKSPVILGMAPINVGAGTYKPLTEVAALYQAFCMHSTRYRRRKAGTIYPPPWFRVLRIADTGGTSNTAES